MRRLVVLVALAGCATGSGSEDAAPPAPADAPPADAPPIDATPAPDGCAPEAERCDGEDQDCDGEVDEDFATLGDGCSTGVGACIRDGVVVCADGGDGVRCTAEAGAPTAELCNQLDDDCDDDVDETFALGASCDGPDADLCAGGLIVCGAGGTAACTDATGDAVETCNGDDDDCDLATDEGFGLGVACDGADGDACAEGLVVCAADGTATCADATGTTVESCNGVDDDCAGGVDDPWPTLGDDCVVGIGACARTGAWGCAVGGAGVACGATAGAATAETCGDAIDQDCTGADVVCPANDGPAGALDISAGGVFTGDLVAARDDHAATGAGCGGTGGRDLYYRFTLPAAEVVYLDTFGSTFDSVLRVFPGSCAAAATPTCDDDAGVCAGLQSQLTAQLAAGSYCVVVDQYDDDEVSGAVRLAFTRGGRTGVPIAVGSGSVAGNTCTASDQTYPTCRTYSFTGDVGYYFASCPESNLRVDASTCNAATWDTVVHLRQGNAQTLADAACSDDGCSIRSAFVDAPVTGAGLNWLIVDGYEFECGTYTLTYAM